MGDTSMDLELLQVICVFGGLAISFALSYYIGSSMEKYNIGMNRLFKNTPGWTGIFILLLVLLCAPAWVYQMGWGYYFFTHLKEGNILLAILAFIIDIVAIIYTCFVMTNFGKSL